MKIFFVLLLFPLLLFGELPSFFKDRFSIAEKGDFIVTEQNKTISLLSIHLIDEKTLILEEITAPSFYFRSKYPSWKKWVETSAPGHSSWMVYEVDLKNLKIKNSYSFSRQSFLKINEDSFFLTKLLDLPLEKLTNDQRRKIGSPPLNDIDRRKIWSPPMIIDGKIQTNSSFNVFKTVWPVDQTELSEKQIELYFDSNNQFFFPYWLEISNAAISVKIKVIDSGKNLSSPQKTTSIFRK